MNILFVTAEYKGLVSIGGLAEVARDLSSVLYQQGHDIRIVMPYYEYIRIHQLFINKPIPIWQGHLKGTKWTSAVVYATMYNHKNAQIPLLLIRGHDWFEQATNLKRIYANESEPQPYFFFAAAVLEFLQSGQYNWLPDIIHCHDYHTGLVPVYLKNRYHGRIRNERIGTVFTIHNLAFQGICSNEILSQAGLSEFLGKYTTGIDSMEYYGKINCMKGAMVFSDMITTVSKTYMREIQTPEQGHGLDGVLTALYHKGRLHGIVNAIDSDLLNPSKLPSEIAYSANDLTGKARAKKELQIKTGLEVSSDPVIAIRSRWAYQKGLELLLIAFRNYEFYKKAQFVIVSWPPDSSDPEYLGLWYELKGWSQEYPKRIAVLSNKKIKVELHYAGSDMLLMPSLFEPCGLTQMEALCYGTIPIVRYTGGLCDTISSNEGFAFKWEFKEPLDTFQKVKGVRAMLSTFNNALDEFQHPKKWSHKVINALTHEHNWLNRVPNYELLYHMTLEKIGKNLDKPKQKSVKNLYELELRDKVF